LFHLLFIGSIRE